MASHPLIITDEEVRSRFPEDEDLANQLATEMIRSVLIRQDEPADMKLENRPDWQEELDLGMDDIRDGRVISHQEHLNWKLRQR